MMSLAQGYGFRRAHRRLDILAVRPVACSAELGRQARCAPAWRLRSDAGATARAADSGDGKTVLTRGLRDGVASRHETQREVYGVRLSSGHCSSAR
jgi:hypothetical protein